MICKVCGLEVAVEEGDKIKVCMGKGGHVTAVQAEFILAKRSGAPTYVPPEPEEAIEMDVN